MRDVYLNPKIYIAIFVTILQGANKTISVAYLKPFTSLQNTVIGIT